MSYDAPQSRNEAILQNILGANNVLVDPQSRIEAILQAILYDETYDEEAMSRMEELLLAIKNNGTWNHEPISRNEEILYAKLNGETYDKEPQSRIEALLIDWLNASPVTYVTDTAPYLFRQSGGDNNAYVGTEETDKLVGASAVVNQLVDTGTTEVATISSHKYFTNINSVVTVQNGTGTAIAINDATEDNVSDLTAMFGTAIAEYIYSLEQATAGSGIAYLRKYGFFTKDYYPYSANTLQSVNTSKHVMRDENNVIIGEYALPNIDLRGLYKLDANNNLYADGDTLEGDGTLTRKYGVVDLGTLNWAYSPTYTRFAANVSGAKHVSYTYSIPNYLCPIYTPVSANDFDNNLPNMAIRGTTANDVVFIRNTSYTDAQAFKTAMSGVYLIYELATPTTEQVTGFTNPQVVDKYGTEEYTDERDFPMPVGHETIYPSR